MGDGSSLEPPPRAALDLFRPRAESPGQGDAARRCGGFMFNLFRRNGGGAVTPGRRPGICGRLFSLHPSHRHHGAWNVIATAGLMPPA